MIVRKRDTYRVPAVFWLLTAATVVLLLWVASHRYGWDLQVYQSGMMSLRAGHDPYADGMELQRWFHRSVVAPSELLPLPYIYGPMTLPVLRWASAYSFQLTGGIYWALYVAGALAVLWVMMRAMEDDERYGFALVAPAAIFFPGLLMQADVIFSGNVAYIVYGAAFLTAYAGWRRGWWGWFYVVVLLASCCKLPMLSLLAIPLFSARRHWRSVCVAAAAGVGMFLLQAVLWPELFRNYLEVLEMQFTYSHDFGMSPAGLLADALYGVVPYQLTGAVVYVLYAVPVFGTMAYLSRRFFAGEFTLREWMPVLMVGTILLNPRIMEYDVAQMTLPMALIAWRFVGRERSRAVALGLIAVGMVLVNLVGVMEWKVTECLLLMGIFGAGTADLLRSEREVQVADAMMPSVLT